MALDRTIAPHIKDAVDFDIQLKPYQKYTLDNGVEVYAFEGGAQEVMLMEFIQLSVSVSHLSCSVKSLPVPTFLTAEPMQRLGIFCA
jgi:hypothetical protein